MGHNGNVSVAMYVRGRSFYKCIFLQVAGDRGQEISQDGRKKHKTFQIVTTALALQPAHFLTPFASPLPPLKIHTDG